MNSKTLPIIFVTRLLSDPMSFYLLASFIAIGAVWLGLRLRNGKGIKHIRGPPSPSLLFGMTLASLIPAHEG